MVFLLSIDRSNNLSVRTAMPTQDSSATPNASGAALKNAVSPDRASNAPEAPQKDCKTRGFWSLIVTQFQGAFSDNAFKMLVTFMVMGLGFSPEQRDRMAPVVGAVFALPFILFSMAGGCLADRYSKRTVAIGTKYAEVLIMLLALIGFRMNSIPLLVAVVFLLSTQSAFFGPAKYGLLPELLPRARLSWGNGVISFGTFVAIITGILAAGLLSKWFAGRQAWSGMILLMLAGLGLAASHGISRVPAADPLRPFQFNVFREVAVQMRRVRSDRVLFLAVLGGAYFWFIAALLQLTILFYGKNVLELDDVKNSLLMAVLAIGIGSGSLAAGYLSGRKIEYGLAPLGAMGIVFFTAMLSLPGIHFETVSLLLAGLGFFGGFYVVPINALIQHRPDPQRKGSVIATNAVLSFTGVFLASCAYYLFKLGLRMSEAQIFLATAALTLVLTAYVMWLLPDALVRLLAWMLTHLVYRIRIEGRANVPEEGGALLVANHVTFVDALLLQASVDRPVRFLVHLSYYERWWLKPVLRLMGAIPVASEQMPRELLRSLRRASEAIERGELVGIFAEGEITRVGQMLPFRPGFERIMRGLKEPIVPVYLAGLWGSIFSYEGNRFFWKWPRRIPYPMTVSFGKAMTASATASEVRDAVQELAGDESRGARVQPG